MRPLLRMHLIPRRVRHQHAASDNTGGALAVARLMLKEKRFVEAATLFERQEDSVRLDDAFMQAAMVAYTELNNPDKVREIAYTLAGLGNGKKAGGQLLKALCSSDSLADAESFLLQWLEHGLQAVGAQLVGASDTFSGSNLFIVPPTKTAVVASLGPIEYNRAASTLISPLLSHLRQRVKLDNSASIQVPADLAPQLFMSAIPWHVWAELVNMYAGRKAWQQSLMLLEFLEGLSALKESSSPPSSSVPHRSRGGDEVIVQITFDRALASAYKQAANSLAAGQQLSRLQDIISRAINHVDNDEALHIAAYVVRTASLWYHSAESQSATEPDDFLTELVATVSTLVSHSSRPSSGAAASPPGKREAALSNLLSATTSALCKQGRTTQAVQLVRTLSAQHPDKVPPRVRAILIEFLTLAGRAETETELRAQFDALSRSDEELANGRNVSYHKAFSALRSSSSSSSTTTTTAGDTTKLAAFMLGQSVNRAKEL